MLPPSIHPDTKKPYTADTNLHDPAVLAELHTLPPDIEGMLRDVLEGLGITLSLTGHTRVTSYVAAGTRDVTMIGVAGMYAASVLRGELSFKESIQHIVAWDAAYVEKIAGDPLDITKGVQKIAEFMVRDVTGPKRRALPAGWDDGLTDAERAAFGFDVFTDLDAAWTFEHIRAEIRQAFVTHDVDTQGRWRAVDFMLERIVKSKLPNLEEDNLLRYVVKAGQMGFSFQALKTRLKELKSSGILGADHTEIAKAIKEELEKAGQIAHEASVFWQWEGSHWQKIDEAKLLKMIAEGYGHLPCAKRFGDHKGILGVLSNMIPRELKQRDEAGVNFANGYLTTQLKLLPHHPGFGCTYVMPYRYVQGEGERAHKFHEFLHSCWSNDEDYEDKKTALQEAMAVTLFHLGPRFERAICLQGPPKSGKSQMLAIINNLVPDGSYSAVNPQNWGARFLPAQLHGKLLNVAGELSDRHRIDGQRFKEIVSGEMITGENKNEKPFTFRPMCTHWFATNHLPQTDDTSAAFSRRWLMLTYNHSVRDDQLVLALGTIIAAEEREAIASWAVDGISRLLAKGAYTLPSSHHERVQEMARINNSIRSFLLDSGKVLLGAIAYGSTSEPIPETTLYNAYYMFATASGVARPVTSGGFRQKMRELGSELGFQVRLIKTPSGGLDCVYEKLTLATGKLVELRRSSGTG